MSRINVTERIFNLEEHFFMWPYHLKVCTKDYIALNFNKTQLNNNKIKVFLTTAYQKKLCLDLSLRDIPTKHIVDTVLWIYYVYFTPCPNSIFVSIEGWAKLGATRKWGQLVPFWLHFCHFGTENSRFGTIPRILLVFNDPIRNWHPVGCSTELKHRVQGGCFPFWFLWICWLIPRFF